MAMGIQSEVRKKQGMPKKKGPRWTLFSVISHSLSDWPTYH